MPHLGNFGWTWCARTVTVIFVERLDASQFQKDTCNRTGPAKRTHWCNHGPPRPAGIKDALWRHENSNHLGVTETGRNSARDSSVGPQSIGNSTLMNAQRFLCLVFTVACATQVNPVLGEAGSYDLSNLPGCVSQSQNAVEGDIPLTRLRYKSFAKKETDDEQLHAVFLARALKHIRDDEGEVFGDDLYVTFAVYYKFEKRIYKQFATAIICRRKFGSKKNECRNRNYFFFSHLDPITLANLLVDDISSFRPVVRRCSWDK